MVSGHWLCRLSSRSRLHDLRWQLPRYVGVLRPSIPLISLISAIQYDPDILSPALSIPNFSNYPQSSRVSLSTLMIPSIDNDQPFKKRVSIATIPMAPLSAWSRGNPR
jgi:hypothetical protein